MNATQRRIRARSTLREHTRAWGELANRAGRLQARRDALALAGVCKLSPRELRQAADILEPPNFDQMPLASDGTMTLLAWLSVVPHTPSEEIHLSQVSTPPSKAKPHGELLTIVHARGAEVARITRSTRRTP